MKDEIIDAELERDGKIQHVKIIGDVITDEVESGTIVIGHRSGNLHGALSPQADGFHIPAPLAMAQDPRCGFQA